MTKLIRFSLLSISMIYFISSFAQAQEPKISSDPELIESFTDHTAIVFSIEGDVQILRASFPSWQPLRMGDAIGEGDQIKTGLKAKAGLHYDLSYLNFIELDENTLAEFKSIEPTQLLLIDGLILNVLNGLPKQSSYEVSGPAAVASVRGTIFSAGVTEQRSYETGVLKGEVTFYPFIDEEERIEKESSYAVQTGKSMTIPSEVWLITDFTADLSPLDENKISEMTADTENAEDDLITYAGGETQYRQAVERWHSLQTDSEIMAIILEALQGHALHLKTMNLISRKASGDVMVSAQITGTSEEESTQDQLIGASETIAGSDSEAESAYTWE
jgi:hypothetical protein